jgi:polygalacturonase
LIINVKVSPYNAVGDGVHDDGPALRAADAAARRIAQELKASGSEERVTVHFPPGTYFARKTIVLEGAATVPWTGTTQVVDQPDQKQDQKQ